MEALPRRNKRPAGGLRRAGAPVEYLSRSKVDHDTLGPTPDSEGRWTWGAIPRAFSQRDLVPHHPADRALGPRPDLGRLRRDRVDETRRAVRALPRGAGGGPPPRSRRRGRRRVRGVRHARLAVPVSALPRGGHPGGPRPERSASFPTSGPRRRARPSGRGRRPPAGRRRRDRRRARAGLRGGAAALCPARLRPRRARCVLRAPGCGAGRARRGRRRPRPPLHEAAGGRARRGGALTAPRARDAPRWEHRTS